MLAHVAVGEHQPHAPPHGGVFGAQWGSSLTVDPPVKCRLPVENLGVVCVCVEAGWGLKVTSSKVISNNKVLFSINLR